MNPLRPIENLLEWALDGLHQTVGLTYGWAIVALTIVVRAALLPLVIKQYRSLRQMQVIAPQIKEIQRKYKDDRRKQQEEVMRLYQENNANPFASCMPMLAQLPVFFALYYVLRDFSGSADDGTDLSFLWIIPDITVYLRDLSAIALIIGLGVYGLSQLLATELSFEPHTPAMQRRILRLLPLPIVITALQFPFPAGLGIYWVTTNLWTAGQMLVIKHIIGLHLSEDAKDQAGQKSRSSRTSSKSSNEPAAVAAPTGEQPAEAGAGASDPESGASDGDAAPTDVAEAPKAGNGSGARKRSGGKNQGRPGRGGRRRPPKKRR